MHRFCRRALSVRRCERAKRGSRVASGTPRQRPLGRSVMSGTIISSIETPPCWKVSTEVLHIVVVVVGISEEARAVARCKSSRVGRRQPEIGRIAHLEDSLAG